MKKSKIKLVLLIALMLFVLTSCNKKDKKPKECKHEESSWVIDSKATCTKTGSKHTECTKCGITIQQETIEKSDHVLVHHNGKDATCDESGYKAYDTCKNCSYTTYQKISALGHNFINDVCNRCYLPSPTNYQYELSDDGTYYIFTGLSNVNNVLNIIISSEYNGLPVEGIGPNAFDNCENVVNIEIPSTIKYFEQTIENESTSLIKCTKLIYNEYDNAYYLGNKENPYVILVKAKNTNISKITINNNTHCISALAFKNCINLTNIEIQNKITNIGKDAFYNCSILTNVYYSGTICDWCNITFSGKPSNPMYYAQHFYMLDENNEYKEVTEIEIPDTVTSIGNYQFYGFNNVTKIIIPFVGSTLDGTYNTHFGYIFGASSYIENANYVPSSLKEVIIAGGENIRENAFRSCISLKSITIPNSVTSIGEYTFRDCGNLTSIVLSHGIRSIDQMAFFDCDKLENLYYSGTIEDWCNITFSGYLSNPMYYAQHFYMLDENNEYQEVTEIEIPNTVTSIGDYQFYGFRNITSITIPNSVTSIGSNAFEGCSSLTSIIIPNSITNIGRYAFFYCRSLTNITIPNSVTSIGSSAFYKCSSLTSITIPFVGSTLNGTSNTHFGYIFGASSDYYNSSYVPSSLKEVIITGGTSIGNYVFSRCSSLKSITLPNSVTSIGNHAFENCSSLKSIEIPNSVTSIGNHAFENCSSLKCITIPNSVTSIGDSAFYNCSSLTSITFEENSKLTSIGSYVFYNCSSLTSIVIPNSVTSIGENAFSNCSSLTSIVIPNSVTSIGEDAFSNCSSLTSIVIPNSVTSIGEDAFSGCSRLTSIEIPNSVTSIGSCAFYNCISLTSITIPNSVRSIGYYAFIYCNNLTIYCKTTSKPSGWDSNWNSSNRPVYWGVTKEEIIEQNGIQYLIIDGNAKITRYIGNDTILEIPEKIFVNDITYNVTSIGDYAFSYCSSLTSITIPNSVISIERYAFSSCSSLTSITIPNGVTSIGYYAFEGCSSLTIYCEKISKPIGWNSNWNYSDRPVYWGVTKEDIIEENGIQYLIIGGNAKITRYVGNDSILEIPETIIVNNIKYKVTSLGINAFSNCSSLTSIIIPNSVTSIGESAFSSCSSLTSIKIPNSVTSIGEYAFRYCYNLTIYCEATSKPSGWDSYWNYSARPVYWGRY